MQSTGQTSTQALSFTPMQASVMMYGIASPQSETARYRWKCKRAALGAQPAGTTREAVSRTLYAISRPLPAVSDGVERTAYSLQLRLPFLREKGISPT